MFCFALVLKAFADCNAGTFLSKVSVATAVSVAESSVVATAVSKGGVSTAVSESVSSVAPQARVAVSRVATQAIAVAVVGVGLGLSLSSSKGRTAELRERQGE